MDAKATSRESVLTSLFCYAVILSSAALVLWPELRPGPGAKVAVGLMTIGMVLVFFRREWKRKSLGLTIPQIYEQAKAGRRFAPRAIELAAIVMWMWAEQLVT